jgi:hypothetical protein
MVPIKCPLNRGITFAIFLIVSRCIESTAARGCYFSEIRDPNGRRLCISNATSTMKTVSNAVQCVFDCKNATFMNVIGIGSEGANIKCEMFNGTVPVYEVKEGCRGFKV